jgi:hypothetical protein
MKPDAAPPVRKFARPPRGVDAKPHLAGLFILGEGKPFGTALQMAFERIVSESPDGKAALASIADSADASSTKIAKPKNSDLQQHRAPQQLFPSIEMSRHDSRIGEFIVTHRMPGALEGSSRHRDSRGFDRHDGFRVISIPKRVHRRGRALTAGDHRRLFGTAGPESGEIHAVG